PDLRQHRLAVSVIVETIAVFPKQSVKGKDWQELDIVVQLPPGELEQLANTKRRRDHRWASIEGKSIIVIHVCPPPWLVSRLDQHGFHACRLQPNRCGQAAESAADHQNALVRVSHSSPSRSRAHAEAAARGAHPAGPEATSARLAPGASRRAACQPSPMTGVVRAPRAQGASRAPRLRGTFVAAAGTAFRKGRVPARPKARSGARKPSLRDLCGTGARSRDRPSHPAFGDRHRGFRRTAEMQSLFDEGLPMPPRGSRPQDPSTLPSSDAWSFPRVPARPAAEVGSCAASSRVLVPRGNEPASG